MDQGLQEFAFRSAADLSKTILFDKPPDFIKFRLVQEVWRMGCHKNLATDKMRKSDKDWPHFAKSGRTIVSLYPLIWKSVRSFYHFLPTKSKALGFIRELL